MEMKYTMRFGRRNAGKIAFAERYIRDLRTKLDKLNLQEGEEARKEHLSGEIRACEAWLYALKEEQRKHEEGQANG